MAATPALLLSRAPGAQTASIPFYTAGVGSAFLPYGEALARFLATRDITLDVRRSAGSLENLRRVEDEPGAIGTAFLGSAVDALGGTAAPVAIQPNFLRTGTGRAEAQC